MDRQQFTQNMLTAFNEQRGDMVIRMIDWYRPEVTMRVKEKIGFSPDAEDLVHDIFEQLIDGKAKFPTIKKFEKFLEILILRICQRWLDRRETRFRKMYVVRDYYQDIEARALEQAEISETAKVIHRLAMELLPGQRRKIYVLHYIRNLRIREIAEQMGLSEKTIENQINLALKVIRKRIRPDGPLMVLIQISVPLLWEHLRSF